MKHLAIIAFAAMCMLFACTKDSMQTNQITENLQVGDRDNNVNICHKTGNGQYNSIWVNQNAVPAHLAHGDYLPDADGDGYSAVGACTGSMDDCDDTNPNVYPGAAEICGNGIDDNCDGNIDENCCSTPCFDASIYPFLAAYSYAYYDSDVNDCAGTNGENVLLFGNFEGTEFVVLIGNLIGVPAIAVFVEGEFECVVAGDDLTEEMYSCNLAALRAAIAAADPAIPNYCDNPPRAAANHAPFKMFENEALRAKMKTASPAKLLEKFNNR